MHDCKSSEVANLSPNLTLKSNEKEASQLRRRREMENGYLHKLPDSWTIHPELTNAEHFLNRNYMIKPSRTSKRFE